jgi:hypothetical protein
MNRRKVKNGIAIVYTLISLLLISVIAFGLLSIVNSYMGVTVNQQKSIKALQLARMGIDYGKVKIQMDYENSDYVGGTSTPITHEIDGGKYTIEITAPASNQTKFDKVWLVTSKGSYEGAERMLEAWVDLIPLTAYNYITNSENSPDNNTQYWLIHVGTYFGKIHTNGHFNVYGKPILYNEMSSSNKNDSYFNSLNRTYTQGGKSYTDPFKFYRYYTNYSTDTPTGDIDFSFAGGKPMINIPKSFADLNINSVTSSIRKDYDVDITVFFETNGVASIEYKDLSGKNTLEKVSSEDILIYSKGNIVIKPDSFYSGTINLVSEKNIDILGNIYCHSQLNDSLALVAQNNVIVKTNENAYKNLIIEAAITAVKGSFYVQNHDQGVYRGALYLFGTVIQNFRGPTLWYSFSGNHRGYRQVYLDNPFMSQRPPKVIPRSRNVRILSVRDKGAIGN